MSNLRTLKVLYKNYGGFKALVFSSFFLVALVLTALTRSLALDTDEKWVELPLTILPSLAGFTVASFALFFAVLDTDQRKALLTPSKEMDGKAPLIVLSTSAFHCLIVQIIAILYSLVYTSKPFPSFDISAGKILLLNSCFSLIGLFLLLYGVVLIISVLLALFRLFSLVSSTQV